MIEGHSEGGQVSNEIQLLSGGGEGAGRGGGLKGRRSTVRFAPSSPEGDGNDMSVMDRGQDVGQGQVFDEEAPSGSRAGGGGSSVGGSVAPATVTGTVAEGGGSSSMSMTRSAKAPALKGILVNGGTKKRPNAAARIGLKIDKATTASTTSTVTSTTRKLNLPPGGPPAFIDRDIIPPAAPLPFTNSKTSTTSSSRRFNFGWLVSAAKSKEPSADSVDGAEVDNEDAVWRIEHRRRLEARRAARKQVTSHTLSILYITPSLINTINQQYRYIPLTPPR